MNSQIIARLKMFLSLSFAAALSFAVVAPAAIAADQDSLGSGNTRIESFNKAKRLLEREVYFDHRVTLYCGAKFDAKKNVIIPEGFTTPKHASRARRIEWEHVVPAENFGRAFVEWREGDESCVDNKGRGFKGRKCAEKANKTFRYMQSDLYNLYPAIGAVNAMRSNYRYSMLPGEPATFGSCAMKIDDEGRRAEPPAYARGSIARSTLYMAASYPQFRLASAQRQLMEAWNRTYPVDEWECIRAKRIEKIQGNENTFVAEPCRRAGWY